MPLIQVTLTTGRDAEQLHALGEALTAAVEQTLGAERSTVRVVLNEVAPDRWFVGGETLAELRATGRRPDPAAGPTPPDPGT